MKKGRYTNPSSSRRLQAFVGLALILLIIVGLVVVLGAPSPFTSRQFGDRRESSEFNLYSPSRETASAPVKIPVTSGQQRATACPIPENWVRYEILPTDSLYRLSIVYNLPVEVLQKGNCLGDELTLKPGQSIYVPNSITGQIAPSRTPDPSPTASKTIPPVFFDVPVQSEPPERDDDSPDTVRPTSVPPTSIPPTNVPPTSVPPTNIPPTSIPPTTVPPTSVPPTATDVPQPTATNPPPPPEPEPPPPDNQFTDNGGTGTAECNGESASVSGNDQNLTFTGICSLTVTGNNNRITVPSGTKVEDKGNGNVITEQ